MLNKRPSPIKTTCLILCRFLWCIQNSSDLLRHGQRSECLVVFWHRDVCSGSFGSCMLGAGASMDRTCFSTSHRWSAGSGSGLFEGLVNVLGSLLWSLCRSWAVYVVCQGSLSCWGGTAMRMQQCQDGWCVSSSSTWGPPPKVITSPVGGFNVVADVLLGVF